jgi:hypothetical protein
MIELIFLKTPYRADRVPQSDFLAVKHNEKLYPLQYQYQKKETFIYGVGWIKIKRKQLITVPVYSRKIAEWDTYLEKYGKYCLYYSLSGGHLGDRDCCTTNQQQEFYRIMQCGGPEKFSQFARNFNAFQKIQKEVIEALPDICSLYSDRMYIKPAYSVVYSFLGCAPYMNTVADDRKLEEMYLYKRKHELKQRHPLSEKLMKLEEAQKKAYEELKAIEADYFSSKYWKVRDRHDEAKEKTWDLYRKIEAETANRVLKEIEDGEVFPVCMQKRITFLFGEKATRYYTNCIEIYRS